MKQFLTVEERFAVEARVKAAEKVTSGEIVVMVVPSSHHYHAASLVGSTAGSMILAILSAWMYGSQSMWVFLAFFGVFFILLNEIIKRNDLFKRFFVKRQEMAEEVEEGAVRSFYHSKVNETAQHTGILLYISIFEHRVRVLADTGISGKIEQHRWQEVADMIIGGIRTGRQSEAICKAVDRCAAMLQEHFPRRQDDSNELGDVVIIGR